MSSSYRTKWNSMVVTTCSWESGADIFHGAVLAPRGQNTFLGEGGWAKTMLLTRLHIQNIKTQTLRKSLVALAPDHARLALLAPQVQLEVALCCSLGSHPTRFPSAPHGSCAHLYSQLCTCSSLVNSQPSLCFLCRHHPFMLRDSI